MKTPRHIFLVEQLRALARAKGPAVADDIGQVLARAVSNFDFYWKFRGTHPTKSPHGMRTFSAGPNPLAAALRCLRAELPRFVPGDDLMEVFEEIAELAAREGSDPRQELDCRAWRDSLAEMAGEIQCMGRPGREGRR